MSTTQQVSSSLLNTMNGTTATSSKSATSTQEAQDRFMKLLITQMKNQDPLNPMDNAQVTSQMAQLSTVTGIEKLNTTMGSLISNVQSSQTYQASSMIGHVVQVSGNSINLSKGEGDFAINLPTRADSVKIAIKNAAGATVRELDLGAKTAGEYPMSWNGFNDAGTQLSDGLYKYEITATLGGKAVAATTMTYAAVNSISNDASGIKLHLDNNTTISSNEVKQVL